MPASVCVVKQIYKCESVCVCIDCHVDVLVRHSVCWIFPLLALLLYQIWRHRHIGANSRLPLGAVRQLEGRLAAGGQVLGHAGRALEGVQDLAMGEYVILK